MAETNNVKQQPTILGEIPGERTMPYHSKPKTTKKKTTKKKKKKSTPGKKKSY